MSQMIKNRTELVNFIRDAHQNKKMTLQEIQRELKRQGYKSPRTGRALSESGLRNFVAYNQRKDKAERSQEEFQMENRWKLIETILDRTDIKPEIKIELINTLRRGS